MAVKPSWMTKLVWQELVIIENVGLNSWRQWRFMTWREAGCWDNFRQEELTKRRTSTAKQIIFWSGEKHGHRHTFSTITTLYSQHPTKLDKNMPNSVNSVNLSTFRYFWPQRRRNRQTAERLFVGREGRIPLSKHLKSVFIWYMSQIFVTIVKRIMVKQMSLHHI